MPIDFISRVFSLWRGEESKPLNADHERSATVLGTMEGVQSAQIADHPSRGRPGEVDAADTFSFVSKQGAGEVKAPLGVTREREIEFRSHVVKAAYDLAASGVAFSQTKEGDNVNEKLWTIKKVFGDNNYPSTIGVRKNLGGGKLGKPSVAIDDMFYHNGKEYGFECGTAMLAIYHKAIKDLLGDECFDWAFTQKRYLKFEAWKASHECFTDAKKRIEGAGDVLLEGSHYYYENPDASESNSAFRGENVIYLGKKNGQHQFYAHGLIGKRGDYIVTEKELLKSLRALRKRGARTEPHRADFRLDIDVNALLELKEQFEQQKAAGQA